jgi:hypothetical protein
MSEEEIHEAPAAEAAHVPPSTTPTWETELLISAAVVIALFQLPGVVDDFFDRWAPRLTGNLQALSFFLLLYAKIVLFALIATFVTHLCARGYWTALIGLRSVFPEGVRWEQAGKRPIFLATMRAELPPLAVTIERVDNFSSLIFGSGALLVILALYSLLVSVAALLLSGALSWLLFDGRRSDSVFFATMALVVVPLVLAGQIDRWFGARIPREGRLARAIRTWLRWSLKVPLLRPANGLMLLYTSNLGRRRGMLLAVGGLYVLIALVFVQTMARRDELRLDSYAYFPAGDQDVVVPRHYANARVDSSRFALTPYVQAETIADPYLRLFVPYAPSRINAAITERCRDVPAAQPRDATAARNAAVLACVATLLAVELDGKPIGDGFEFAMEPETGLRGFLAHIAIEGLPKGRHELTLERLPRAASTFGATDAEKLPRERIAFWR